VIPTSNPQVLVYKEVILVEAAGTLSRRPDA